MVPDKILRGVAGEYLVAGELSKRGIIASITLKNTKGIDVLASNKDASKSVGIQVKTTMYPRKNYPMWLLSDKADDYHSENLYYVFVLLKNLDERPEFYVVRSRDVANHTKTGHANYLRQGRKKGITYHSKLRNFTDKNKQYLEQWDLLGL